MKGRGLLIYKDGNKKISHGKTRKIEARCCDLRITISARPGATRSAVWARDLRFENT
jgi:hypothetical protein